MEWGCVEERDATGRWLLRLAAISRQRPHLSLLATTLDVFSCSTEQDSLWLQHQMASATTRSHTHAAAWLNRHGVGGQKGQMGIFANVTLATDRSHPRELSLGAKRTAGRSGRRVRLG